MSTPDTAAVIYAAGADDSINARSRAALTALAEEHGWTVTNNHGARMPKYVGGRQPAPTFPLARWMGEKAVDEKVSVRLLVEWRNNRFATAMAGVIGSAAVGEMRGMTEVLDFVVNTERFLVPPAGAEGTGSE